MEFLIKNIVKIAKRRKSPRLRGRRFLSHTKDINALRKRMQLIRNNFFARLRLKLRAKLSWLNFMSAIYSEELKNYWL